MKTFLLIGLLATASFGDDWFQADQARYTIEESAKTQADATENAARIQAEATDRQTEAIESQASDSYYSAQYANAIKTNQLLLQAQAQNQCQFKMLVNNKTGKPLYYTDVDGNTAGPIYVKDCGGN